MTPARSTGPAEVRPGARILRLTIAYDGTAFAGWQRQPDARTVQGVLEDALRPFFERTGLQPTLHGAGRTDAGVHALGQVASIAVPLTLPAPTIQRALNVTLPVDVRVVALEDAAPGFHARFDATGKTYRYRVAAGAVRSPFDRWFVWHVPRPVDIEAMRAGARLLTGRQDFASFQARDSAIEDTVRTLERIDILDRRAETGEVVLEIEGDGFLRHMVRVIAGTLVEVGWGTRTVASVAGVLAARDRTAAGRTAPPSGLTLVKVRY